MMYWDLMDGGSYNGPNDMGEVPAPFTSFERWWAGWMELTELDRVKMAEEQGVKNAKIMWPVRIAAAGKAVTPGGAVEICRILGREETLRRLRIGLEKLG